MDYFQYGESKVRWWTYDSGDIIKINSLRKVMVPIVRADLDPVLYFMFDYTIKYNQA